MSNVAAITMFRGDHFWLDLWLRHYEKALGGRENLYVIVHGEDTIARELLQGASLIYVPYIVGDTSFERRRMRLVHSLAGGLLQYFQRVIFTDTDELLCLHPDGGGDLAEYLCQHEFAGKALSSVGVEILSRAGEPALDPTKKILRQRDRCVISAGYCKPNVFFQPIGRANQHRIPGEPLTIDRNLLLFHLRYVDFERFLSTSEQRKAHASAAKKNVGGWDQPLVDYQRKLAYSDEQKPLLFSKSNIEPFMQRIESVYLKKGRPGARVFGNFTIPAALKDLV